MPARGSFRRCRAVRLGVPAAARRRPLLRHARGRARRTRSWISAAAPGGCCCRCCGPVTSSSGVDRAPAMLARAAARVGRLAPGMAAARCCCARICAGSRSRAAFLLAVAAFHTIQHLGDRSRADALLRGRRARAGAGRLVRLRHLRPERAVSRPRERGRAAGDGRGRGSSTRRPAVRPNIRRAIDSMDALLTTTFHYRAVGPGQRRAAADRRVDARPSAARTGRHSGAAGRHRPHPDRELGRLRRPAAGAANRAAHLPPPSWNDAPNSGRLPTPPTRQDKKIDRELPRRKPRGFPLDRIMSPDTMTADFQ